MSHVAENFAAVRARIVAACARVGRPEDSVRLIAVSKRQPEILIREAFAAGQRDFGENYAQELRDKAQSLADLRGLRWHALGALQLNKAKYVAQHAHLYHALEDAQIAAELARRRQGPPLICFLEVNLGGEETKEGIAPNDAADLLAAARTHNALEVVGMMALPPLGPSPEDSRPHFRRLHELAAQMGLARLSMGTTYDFEIAIEEGATDIRVGEAIFGKRPAH